MHYFNTKQVPVISALAKQFAVCDQWFASAPCQTWPNRWFVHTAPADGHENNEPIHVLDVDTIYNRCELADAIDWKIYFPRLCATSMTTHARGARYLDSESRAALDIGALHGRAISIDGRGKVLNYKMTRQCA